MKTYSQLLKELNVSISTREKTTKYLRGVNPKGQTDVPPKRIKFTK